MGPVERVMVERVAADPVTAVLAEVVGGVVRDVLTEHLPKLTVTQQEAARIGGPARRGPGMSAAEQVAANIHRQRKANGWTLAEVATRMTAAGVPMKLNTVCKVEKATRNVDRAAERLAHLIATRPGTTL